MDIKEADDIKRKRLELHRWQNEAISFFYKSKGIALYQVATGAGKTILAIELIKKIFVTNPNIKVLIIVPKNVILEQTWYTELYANGFSIRDIGFYYGKCKEYAKITITNIQSIDDIYFDLFDCVVYDEVHNMGTKRLLEYCSAKKKYKIGLSATVEKGRLPNYELWKMFNYNVFDYSPVLGIEEGVLNEFDYTTISVDMDFEQYMLYETLTKQIDFIVMSSGIPFRFLIRGKSPLKNKLLAKYNERKMLVNNYERKFDVVKMICEKHKDAKIIVFNEFNTQSNKLYFHLLDTGLNPCVFHSAVKQGKKEQNLKDYRDDKFNLLLATRAVDEGYNLPKIDVAIIMAGNSTKRQTIQRIGRVLRKKDKPSHIYHIYCKDTVEEEYVNERKPLFRSLCNRFSQMNYNLKGELI